MQARLPAIHRCQRLSGHRSRGIRSRTCFVWDIHMQRPHNSRHRQRHASSHKPVAALALLRLLIQLIEGPECLIYSFLLYMCRLRCYLLRPPKGICHSDSAASSPTQTLSWPCLLGGMKDELPTINVPSRSGT